MPTDETTKKEITTDVTTAAMRAGHGEFCEFSNTIRDMTESKKSEDAIRRVQEECDRTFDNVPDLIAILDNNHRIVRVNDSFAKRLGMNKEECTGALCYEVVHGSSIPPDFCPHLKTLQDGLEHTEEQHLENFGGDFQITTSPLQGENGEQIGSVHVAHDITGRKQMEEALRESEERLALALEGGRMGLWEWDQRFDRLVWNAIEYQLLGLPVGAGVEAPHRFFDLVHPEDAGLLRQILSNINEGESYFQHELRIIRANDGQVRWLEVAGRLYRDAAGQPVRIVGINYDITERKLSEDKLKKLNEELEKRVEERTKVLIANVEKLMTEIVERKKAEESVLRLNRIYKVVSETNQVIVRTMDRETIFNEFCRIAVEDGKFKLAWVGLMDEDNSELRLVAAKGATGYLDDIKNTDNNEAKGIGQSGIFVREGIYHISTDLLGSPDIPIWHEKCRAHGICSSASVALKQEGKVIGALTLYADKKDFFDRQQSRLLQQMGADVSFALDNIVRETRRKEAEKALSEETIERLRTTEALREKEQMLIQQSRQAAMGEMIGNIAHQWRQPLNTLGLTIQQLLLFYDMDEFTREFLEQSVDKSMQLIQHMSKTIDDFRNYFRPDKEKVEFELCAAVASTLSLIEDSFKNEHIGIEYFAKSEPVIVGYRNEYAQVVLNILNNARDVFKERNIKEPQVSITIFTEGGKAVVTIADNGGGIPEEIMGKVFDPYFTTKGPQLGTGVGLFMSKTIIESNMGGRLTVRNHGNGAEFRIEV